MPKELMLDGCAVSEASLVLTISRIPSESDSPRFGKKCAAITVCTAVALELQVQAPVRCLLTPFHPRQCERIDLVRTSTESPHKLLVCCNMMSFLRFWSRMSCPTALGFP